MYILIIAFLILGILAFLKYLRIEKKATAIIIATITIVLVFVSVAYFMYNKPHRDVAGTQADFAINATDLFQQFSENEDSANAVYLEKIIAVKGVVQGNVNTDNAAEPTVFIETGDDFGVISCGFSESELPTLNNLKPGDNIQVKGLCKGKNMDVVLTNCTLIDDVK